MLVICTVPLILAISVNFINAQSCTTPTKEQGECVSLFKCDFLLAIVKKNNNMTPKELKLLRDSQCGYQNKDPKVCCPNSNACVTPEGDPGKCIDLYKCKHIYETLRNASNKEQVGYLSKYVCDGPEKYNVCCGPPPSADRLTNKPQQNPPLLTPPKPKPNSILDKCSKMMNAFPPERSSKCCGIDSSFDNKIIGGNETGIYDYPWLVVIEYVNIGQSNLLCGGSLISGKYVLTAAHCVTGRVLELGTPKNVRLGDYDIGHDGRDCVPAAGGGIDCTKPVIIAPIEKTIPHPDHEPNSKKNDIALIRLQITAPYTDFIRPICLPSKDYVLNQPKEFPLYIAGWGQYVQYADGSGLDSKVKLYAKVPYVDKNVCESTYSALGNTEYNLWDEQICAGGEGKDACRGDSGGPLMYQDIRTYEAFGIVSNGLTKCAYINTPAIYTNVYKYISWIKRTIEP